MLKVRFPILAVLIGIILFGCQSTKPTTSSVSVAKVPPSLPKTMAELAPKGSLQDARPILEKAYVVDPLHGTLMKVTLFDSAGAEPWGGGEPANDMGLEPKTMRALDLIIEASKKTEFSSGRDRKSVDRPESVDPMLRYLKEGAGLLSYRGKSYAKKGNTDAALVDFRAALNLVRFTLQQPFALRPENAAKLHGKIAEDLKVALAYYKRDKESLAKFRAMLNEVAPKEIDS